MWGIIAAALALVLYLDCSLRLRGVLRDNLSNPLATSATSRAFRRLTYSIALMSTLLLIAVIAGSIDLPSNWGNASNNSIQNYQDFDASYMPQIVIWVVGMAFALWIAWIPFRIQCSPKLRIVYISSHANADSPGNSPVHKLPNSSNASTPNGSKHNTLRVNIKSLATTTTGTGGSSNGFSQLPSSSSSIELEMFSKGPPSPTTSSTVTVVGVDTRETSEYVVMVDDQASTPAASAEIATGESKTASTVSAGDEGHVDVVGQDQQST